MISGCTHGRMKDGSARCSPRSLPSSASTPTSNHGYLGELYRILIERCCSSHATHSQGSVTSPNTLVFGTNSNPVREYCFRTYLRSIPVSLSSTLPLAVPLSFERMRRKVGRPRDGGVEASLRLAGSASGTLASTHSRIVRDRPTSRRIRFESPSARKRGRSCDRPRISARC
jgi:hypothetical protein